MDSISSLNQRQANTPKEAPTAALTQRQAAVLRYVCNYKLEFGYPPTIREIGDHMQIRSTNGVNDHLKALERKGYILREESKSRAITPLYMPDKQPYDQWMVSKKNLTLCSAMFDEDVYTVPLVGRIAAGTPIAAIENQEGLLRVGSSLIGNVTGVFALTVHGDSMIEDGIFDGDTIFVRPAKKVVDGTIVAAMIQDCESEATVKRIFHEEGRIRLQPANSTMEPIYVNEGDGRTVEVIGEVIALFRTIKK